MSEYDDWKQENDRWEAYLYPNGVLRNKLGITKAAKWHKTECEFVAARNNDLRPNTGLTTGNVGEELFAGTTSACAENTRAPGLYPHQARNYLRVRGEYQIRKNVRCPALELPPRARRIHSAPPVNHDILGTTSACAENTTDDTETINMHGNYLRVRGEYLIASSTRFTTSELPPRARRIHIEFDLGKAPVGTTSACAENTGLLRLINPPKGNYLRVRGEYLLPVKQMIPPAELPPRARRIRITIAWGCSSNGTTSACAENTSRL